MNYNTISRIADYGTNYSKYIEVIAVRVPDKYDSKMFRITIITENGFPIGYNINCQLEVWSHAKGWIRITDNKMAGIDTYRSDYHAAPEKKQEMSEATAAAFKEYIEKIISYV